MFGNRKYRLLAKEKVVPSVKGWPGGSVAMHRIQALRDIPEKGVRKGDVGGYVSNGNILSHEGSCWIAHNAQAIMNVRIKEDAYLGGNAIVVSRYNDLFIQIYGNVQIIEYAQVRIRSNPPSGKRGTSIYGNTMIYGNATISEAEKISGNVKIYGHASIEGADEIVGDIDINDTVTVRQGTKLFGKTKISGTSTIDQRATLNNCLITGDSHISAGVSISNFIVEDNKEIKGFAIQSKETGYVPHSVENKSKASVSPEQEHTFNIFNEVKKDIASYETDIVKIIKYPVMTDRTDYYTMKMIMALKNAERLSIKPSSADFADAVTELEGAFLAAESNAIKVASSLLSDEEKKKTEKAKDLFRIAENEASAENEKKVAFVQGFKQLEGVITVPEVAVDTFRIKLGLKEIEM